MCVCVCARLCVESACVCVGKGRETERRRGEKRKIFLVVFSVHVTPNFVLELEFISASYVHMNHERIAICQ